MELDKEQEAPQQYGLPSAQHYLPCMTKKPMAQNIIHQTTQSKSKYDESSKHDQHNSFHTPVVLAWRVGRPGFLPDAARMNFLFNNNYTIYK